MILSETLLSTSRASLLARFPSSIRRSQTVTGHASEGLFQDGLLTPVLHRFDAHAFDTGCFTTASREIYVECEHLNFDEYEVQRSSYAVQLTLCELSVAGITPPVQCQLSREEGDLRACLYELELRPQWWTTFSGYFRDA